MLSVTDDFRLALAAIFQVGWKIVTSFHIPGTNMNLAEFCVAALIIVFVLRKVPGLIGLGPSLQINPMDMSRPDFELPPLRVPGQKALGNGGAWYSGTMGRSGWRGGH